jgi:hypothetical protein
MHSVWAVFQTTAWPSTLPIQLADIAPASRRSRQKPKAFAESLNSRFRLFYPPTRQLKADTIGRMAITDKANFRTNIRAPIQKESDKFAFSTKINSSNTPHER